jgi:hypothetical protein
MSDPLAADFDSLISVIDSLIAFANRHAKGPLGWNPFLPRTR